MEDNNNSNKQLRQVAIKIWINKLINGKYVVKEGWNPNCIIVGEEEIARTNIMGVVVQKSDSELLNYQFIVIDDGSARITIRAFENKEILSGLEVGDVINIIGRPREFGKEIYIIPEIIKKITDNKWLEVRKLELGNIKEIDTPKDNNYNIDEIEIEDIETPKERLIKIIKSIDASGLGVDIDEIIDKAKNHNTENLIKEMINYGDLFEIKPGKIKILE